MVGSSVGVAVGSSVGSAVGGSVGVAVGSSVGSAVHVEHEPQIASVDQSVYAL